MTKVIMHVTGQTYISNESKGCALLQHLMSHQTYSNIVQSPFQNFRGREGLSLSKSKEMIMVIAVLGNTCTHDIYIIT